MPDETIDATLRWKIDKDLELYRFYLDMSVKVAVFVMTVTGAIASYVLSNSASRVSKIGLLFPALMNAGFAVLFFYSIRQAQVLFDDHKSECEELGIADFHMGPLKSVCQIFCLMCSVATIGLFLLIAYT